VRDLHVDGYFVRREDLAQLSPYQTRRLKRLGDYTLSLGAPDPFETDLVVPFRSKRRHSRQQRRETPRIKRWQQRVASKNATRRKSFRGKASTSRRTVSIELRSA